MSATTVKAAQIPAHVPPGAERTTLGALADREMDLGDGRKRVRISFRHGRLHATGPLLSIERSECGAAGRLHVARGWRGQHYIFATEDFDATPCWIWTVADERRAEAARNSVPSVFSQPIVKP